VNEQRPYVTHVTLELSIGVLAEAMALTNSWDAWSDLPPSTQEVYLNWSERIVQQLAKGSPPAGGAS
jgi:hypothetical protein